jgi:hypothetical protein
MPTYDATRFNPPAPMAQVGLRNPDTGTVQSDVPMLLDTGADVTLVPQAVTELLQVAVIPSIQYELMGFDGDARFVPAVRLELVFCGRTFRGQFLLTEEMWGILGRNVLNAIPLLLDGPALTWDEHHLEYKSD